MQRTRVADEIKALVALVRDGQKTRDDALREVDPQKLLSTLRPSLPSAEVLAARGHPLLARGLSASAGVGSGEIAFHASRVLELAAARKDVVLVRPETSAEDVHALRVSRAVLTVTGGLTSHAAVMARGVGKPCVVGCDALRIDEHKATLEITDPDTRVMVRALKEGDVITVDGNSGNVYQGAVPPVPAAQLEELQSVLEWADERRTLAVFGNASNAQDAQDAMQAGAAGIGLCRLEQMLTAPTAADLVRVVFFANDEAAKTLALGELKTFIVSELTAIYAVAKDTTVRLFDAPAMDFAPTNEHETHALAKRLGVSPQTMVAFIQDQRERWPAFGARGVRMCVTQPDFARMQIDSVQSAATLAGTTARILVPFVSMAEELAHIRSLVGKDTELGSMLETPRACLIARDLAKHVSFIAFGTNDLTQATFGMGRDDAHNWLSAYKRLEPTSLSVDPFRSLDRNGVGALMRLAILEARSVRENLHVYLCGEHAADTATIGFAQEIGANGVSCGPSLVPAARLSAGKAAAAMAR